MNLILPLVLIVTIYSVWSFRKQQKKAVWQLPKEPFSQDWKNILIKYVSFYKALSKTEKTRFEFKIQEFLLNCRITGISTTVDDTDKILVAASAIIPIFAFDDWKYTNINEVLVYPNSFNKNFETEGPDRNILGLVGNGYMEGKMILSKLALKRGFENETDKKNTAIHEFVHLIDKSDGTIDGIPSLLLEKQYTIPWIDLINKKIKEIYDGTSDINPYGGTNNAEFFSVASEYFFEQPQLLQRKHPELYEILESIFHQKMSSRKLMQKNTQIRRNAPCPCNSGKKFKKCCGSSHYA